MSRSNTNINDLKKDFQEQLQIDADLANATDVTAPWSFTTPANNRTGNDDNIVDDWDKFYNHVDKTPPKATRDVAFKTAVQRANHLLRLSDFEEFADKQIEGLTEDQQAIMMLMIIKKIDEAFAGKGDHEVAKILVGALKPKTDEYKLFMAFVRRGGDRECVPTTSTIVDRFNRTLEAFVTDFSSQTKLEDATTIFDKKEGMMPFLQIQRGSSYICAFNACAVLMYYYSYNVADQKATKANISKYIRDELDGLKIANLTLTKEKGSSLKEILAGLMASFGTVRQEDSVTSIEEFGTLDEDDQDWNYMLLHRFLKQGRPFALRFEGFPDSNDPYKEQYIGKLSDHYQDISERPGPGDRSYHAVVCIGIKPRKGTNPPMLLLQDSSASRPAFSMGLDLLMDMGIENLQFCTLPKYWNPNEGMRYKVTDKSRVFFAGSPMSIDKNNKPYIVTRKEPVQEKRDMSYYLHPSGPGTPQVYFM